ncbi:hypothetical protein [Nonomuraea candida]|nr:hypothetical protein [Nonomuraea candida]
MTSRSPLGGDQARLVRRHDRQVRSIAVQSAGTDDLAELWKRDHH